MRRGFTSIEAFNEVPPRYCDKVTGQSGRYVATAPTLDESATLPVSAETATPAAITIPTSIADTAVAPAPVSVSGEATTPVPASMPLAGLPQALEAAQYPVPSAAPDTIEPTTLYVPPPITGAADTAAQWADTVDPPIDDRI